MARHRLFLALTPPAPVLAQITRQAEALPADGKATPPEKLHLTLAFLGDADPAAAAQAGAGAAARIAPFDFALDEADSFAGGVWFLRAPAAPFAALLAALFDALHAAGLHAHDASRAFVPHLTLRRRAAARLPRRAIAPIGWPARELRLYDSDLATGRYALRGRWPLAGGNTVNP